MKSSALLALLLVWMFFGSPAYSAATVKEELIDDSTANEADDFTFDPCQLEVVTCDYEKTIEEKIKEAAIKAGINPETAIRIAYCESRFDPMAKNKSSSATGLYQFTRGTWLWIGAEEQGLVRTKAEDSIAMFAKWYLQHPSWWECK